MAMKTCTKCLVAKQLSEFHRHKRFSDGHDSRCKTCRSNGDVERKYGVSINEYQKRLNKQNDGCAICGRTCTTGKRLSVDHCHDTGRVRGLLCRKCNIGIANFSDNVERLFEAIMYLNENTNQ